MVDGEEGSAETGDPGRAGGCDRNWTFLFCRIDLQLDPLYSQALPAGVLTHIF